MSVNINKLISILLLSGTLIWGVYYNDIPKATFILVASLCIIAVLNFEDLKSISALGFSLEKAERKYNELSEETEQLIDDLELISKGLIEFAFAQIKKDGYFDNITDFDSLADMIEIIKKSSYEEEKLKGLLKNVIPNLLGSFSYKAKNAYNVDVEQYYTRSTTIKDIFSSEKENYYTIDRDGLYSSSNNPDYQKMLQRILKIIDSTQ